MYYRSSDICWPFCGGPWHPCVAQAVFYVALSLYLGDIREYIGNMCHSGTNAIYTHIYFLIYIYILYISNLIVKIHFYVEPKEKSFERDATPQDLFDFETIQQNSLYILSIFVFLVHI